MEKRYFCKNKVIHNEKSFDKDARYTYYFEKENEMTIKCPNCSYIGNKEEFFDGCPYCGTSFNIDYDVKKISFVQNLKEIINSKVYKVSVTLIALIAVILGTFNTKSQDTPFIVLLMLAPIKFLIYWALSHMFITILLIPYLIIKVVNGGRQTTIIDKIKNLDNSIKPVKFLNDLYYELNLIYYNDHNNSKYLDLIDFDIIKFENIEVKNDKNNKNNVVLDVIIREIYFKNNKIFKKINKRKIDLKRNNIIDVVSNNNIVVICKNCGASIDITSKECEYCHAPVKYKSEWEIKEII